MSTYEADHNISSRSPENTTSTTNDQQRHRPTLTQSVASFLNDNNSATSSEQTNNILEALRQSLENSELDESQRETFLQSISNNNVVADLFSSISMNADDDDNVHSKGIDDSFLDTLERVPLKKIKKSETCPICTNDYHSDPYPLIVRLPCNDKHFFDLDCIGPWLKLNKTCPLCRVDVTVKKPLEVLEDSEQEEEDWEMYG